MAQRRRSTSYTVRRVHRYLGLFIGIQFLLWTLGGLYFSWTDLDAVHGDDLHAVAPRLKGDARLASPGASLEEIRRLEPVDSLAGLELVRVLGTPVLPDLLLHAWRCRTDPENSARGRDDGQAPAGRGA